MPKSIQILIALTAVFMNAYSFQPPSPVDLFPLHKGFSFEYHILYDSTWTEFGSLWELYADSGWVQCTVLDSAASGDTAIVWTISERARLFHRHFIANHDTTYRTDDSTQISLMESRAGNHPLSCAGLVWDFSFNDPSPIVTRYSDSASLTIIRIRRTSNPPIDGFDTLCFSREGGFFRRAGILTYQRGLGIYVVDRWQVDLIGATMVGVDQTSVVAENFKLLQNYPNPFNPTTMIRYGLPNGSHVTMTVYNTLGQQVAQLVNGEMEAGFHEVKFDAAGLSSGVYFYRLQAGAYMETKALLLVR
jgi:hypothetical protein